MGKGRPSNPHCRHCGVVKTPENCYYQTNGNFSSYCASCSREVHRKRRARMKIEGVKKQTKKRSVATRQWEKVNKNHYPDPEWVWQQIEMNESPASFHEKLEQKYALSKHGNSGKVNRWKNKNGTRMNSQQMKKNNNIK